MLTERVGNGGGVDLANLERDGSQLGHGTAEHLHQVGGGQVQDTGVVDGTILVHGGHFNTELEGLDAELGQQSHGGGGHLLAGSAQTHFGSDLNTTLGDLGSDVEGLEEGGLSRVEAGRTRGHGHVDGSNHTSLGGSGHLELGHLFADAVEVRLGEDETHVAPDVRQQVGQVGVLPHVVADDLTHDGVLAHQHNAFAADGRAHLLHLLGPDEVNSDDEDVLVLIESAFKLGPVLVGVLALLFDRDFFDFFHVYLCGDWNLEFQSI